MPTILYHLFKARGEYHLENNGKLSLPQLLLWVPPDTGQLTQKFVDSGVVEVGFGTEKIETATIVRAELLHQTVTTNLGLKRTLWLRYYCSITYAHPVLYSLIREDEKVVQLQLCAYC